MMVTIKSHEDLIVWQKFIELALAIYHLTENFPKDERFGLTSQLRRASVSIPSNIAEGRYRGTRKDYIHFLRIALGSVAEVETQIHLAKRLALSPKEVFSTTNELTPQIGKMLKVMIQKLGNRVDARSQQLEAS